AGYACTAAAHEKIQVCALMRLLHVFDIEPFPSPLGKRWRRPVCLPRCECTGIDFECETTSGYIQAHAVACLNKGEWSSGCCLGTGVKHHGAVCSSTHARIGNANHILDTLAEHFRR